MSTIERTHAPMILDAHGSPTLEVDVRDGGPANVVIEIAPALGGTVRARA